MKLVGKIKCIKIHFTLNNNNKIKSNSISINWPLLPSNDVALNMLEENILPKYLPGCRWFGGKSQVIESIKIEQIITFPCESNLVYFLLLKVTYTQGAIELYNFPIAYFFNRQLKQTAINC